MTSEADDTPQCGGYRTGGPCSAEPRFQITVPGGRVHLYCCGWHLVSTILREVTADTVTVRTLW